MSFAVCSYLGNLSAEWNEEYLDSTLGTISFVTANDDLVKGFMKFDLDCFGQENTQ